MIISILQTDFDTLFSTETCPDWLQKTDERHHYDHVSLKIDDAVLNQEMVNWLLQHAQFLASVEFEPTTLIQLLDTEQGRHLLWHSPRLRGNISDSDLRSIWTCNREVVENSEKQALLDFLLVSTSAGRTILRKQSEFDYLLARKRLGTIVPYGDCQGMSLLFYLVQDNLMGVSCLNHVKPTDWESVYGQDYCVLNEVAQKSPYQGQSIFFWMLKYIHMLDLDQCFPHGCLLDVSCLNAIVDNGQYQGESVSSLLLSKLPQLLLTQCGRQWVEGYDDLWAYITSDDLNTITLDRQTVFFKLLATTAGQAILRTRHDLWPAIAGQYTGQSSWPLLLTTAVGKAILEQHPEWHSNLSVGLINTLLPLLKTDDELAILEQHPEWLNNLSVRSINTLLPVLLLNDKWKSKLQHYPQLLASLLGTEEGLTLANNFVEPLQFIGRNMTENNALALLHAIAALLPDNHPHLKLSTIVKNTGSAMFVYPLLANLLVKLSRGALGSKPEVEEEINVRYKSYLLYAKLAKDKYPEFQTALRDILLDNTSLKNSAAEEMLKEGEDYSKSVTKGRRRSTRSLSFLWPAENPVIVADDEQKNSSDEQTISTTLTPMGSQDSNT